jgi:hypothetical protein
VRKSRVKVNFTFIGLKNWWMALPSSEMVRLIRQSIFSKKEKKIGLKCGLGISD